MWRVDGKEASSIFPKANIISAKAQCSHQMTCALKLTQLVGNWWKVKNICILWFRILDKIPEHVPMYNIGVDRFCTFLRI